MFVHSTDFLSHFKVNFTRTGTFWQTNLSLSRNTNSKHKPLLYLENNFLLSAKDLNQRDIGILYVVFVQIFYLSMCNRFILSQLTPILSWVEWNSLWTPGPVLNSKNQDGCPQWIGLYCTYLLYNTYIL